MWPNWVLRLPDGTLAGYVQATVFNSGTALVAYDLTSRFWRQGIGSTAVVAMLDELRSNYGVRLFAAVLNGANYRSLGLLRKLGFEPGSTEQAAQFGANVDEIAMIKYATTEKISSQFPHPP